MLEESTPTPQKSNSFRKLPQDRSQSVAYAQQVKSAWKRKDRKEIDRLCDLLMKTGQFNTESLHGIFNFYVEIQDVDAILRFAERFHVSKQPPATSWYNRALSRLISVPAQKKMYEEIKKRNIPLSILNQIKFEKRDEPVDFEQAIQDYKDNPSTENAIKLGQGVSEQLTREEQERDVRIFHQLTAHILPPSEVCFILLRHAAMRTRAQFAHQLCSYMNEHNIKVDNAQVYSLMIISDAYHQQTRSMINSFVSLLEVITPAQRAKKDLALCYVFRRSTSPALIQEKLNLIESMDPTSVYSSLHQRLTLWGQVGNPIEMVLATHATLCDQAKSPYDKNKLDLTLLEISGLYAIADIAVKLAERIKFHSKLQNAVYSALFHALLAAGQHELFQQYHNEYYNISPDNADKTVLSVASRFGFPEALASVLKHSESRMVPLLEPARKYRMMLISAIRAKNAPLVQRIWKECSMIHKDPIALNGLIIYFKKDLKHAESLASQLDHPLVHKAMILVYAYHHDLAGILWAWSKIQSPKYSTWVWFLRRLPDSKLILDALPDAIKAFPQAKQGLQKAAVAGLIKIAAFEQAFNLLSKSLEETGPGAYVDPALIAIFGSSIRRLRAREYLPVLEDLCQKYPSQESLVMLNSVHVLASKTIEI